MSGIKHKHIQNRAPRAPDMGVPHPDHYECAKSHELAIETIKRYQVVCATGHGLAVADANDDLRSSVVGIAIGDYVRGKIAWFACAGAVPIPQCQPGDLYLGADGSIVGIDQARTLTWLVPLGVGLAHPMGSPGRAIWAPGGRLRNPTLSLR